jgi:pimeloyl-ACP methyl ester carboxylesterase
MTTTSAIATGPAQAANPQTNQTPNPPKGRFFANQTFHFETLRGAGYIQSGGADIGEVLETVKQIADDDQQSWFAAWSATSERVFALAQSTRDPISKGNAYLRAHGYQRTGGFLLPPDDPKRPASWEKEVAYFYKGLDALGIRYERLAVPYEGSSLRALYIPGPQGAEKKPLIVLAGGFDSSLEELYLVLGRAAGDRGYSVLCYEGPGQGQALRNGLKFTPQWERPTGAVLNEFERLHGEPAKMVLIGMSMGGYFAPRAAAFDERIDGVVAYDTCFDASESAGRVIAVAANPNAMQNPDVAWGYKNALWTLGTKGLEDTAKAFASYTLAPVAHRIRQDVLILAGTEDHFNPFHQTADFEKALVNARSVTTRIFDRASGGAQHCQCGAVTLVYAAVFDWLLEKFGAAGA